jgi:hypothetical protein
MCKIKEKPTLVPRVARADFVLTAAAFFIANGVRIVVGALATTVFFGLT